MWQRIRASSCSMMSTSTNTLILIYLLMLSSRLGTQVIAFVPQRNLHRLSPSPSQSRIRSKSSSTSTIKSATLAPEVPRQPSMSDVVDSLFNPQTTTPTTGNQLNSTDGIMPDITSDIFSPKMAAASPKMPASTTSSTTTATATTTTKSSKRSRIRRIPSLIKSKIPAWIKTKRSKSIILFATLSMVMRLAFQTAQVTPLQLIQQCIQKFIGDWKTYTMIPFLAAFVGWITNYLAVQMIFYPIQWRGIPIKKNEGEPLGLLGWQGIIPAKTAKMSEAMVNVTIGELLSMEETIQKLDPDEVATILSPEVPEMTANNVNSIISSRFDQAPFNAEPV